MRELLEAWLEDALPKIIFAGVLLVCILIVVL